MARARSIKSIETEISKVEADLAKAQEKCDALAARLLELQKTKQEIEAKQVMDAFRKSGNHEGTDDISGCIRGWSGAV